MEEKGHEVTGFFYNPNIHPYQEYKSRKVALEKYVERKAARVIYKDDYDIENYLCGALSAEDRCRFCYTLRLAETAKTAGSLGFDAFTTTLLISPYQKHEMIAEVGKRLPMRTTSSSITRISGRVMGNHARSQKLLNFICRSTAGAYLARKRGISGEKQKVLAILQTIKKER